MGFYIKTPITIGKAGYLKKEYDAVEIPSPSVLAGLPGGKALVCVVENPMFDAALYVYNDSELSRTVSTKTDHRKRTWLLMDEKLVQELSGYTNEDQYR